MNSTKYRLKNKYGHLPFKGQTITNENITDAIGKRLMKEHPRGADLFTDYPDKPEDELFQPTIKEPVPSEAEVDANEGEERKKKALEKIAGWSSTQIADAKKSYSIDSNLKGKALHEEIYKHTSKL